LDRVFDMTDDQTCAEFCNALVTELNDFVEIVAGIDVYQRERKFSWTECFFRDTQQHDRILAAGEQQSRVSALGCDFPHDVDGFRFEPIEMSAAGRIQKIFIDNSVHDVPVHEADMTSATQAALVADLIRISLPSTMCK